MTKFSFMDIDRQVMLNSDKTAICIDYTLKVLGLRIYHKLNSNALPIDVKAVIEDGPKRMGFNKE